MDATPNPAGSLRRALLVRVAVLGAAVALGLALQHALAQRLTRIDALAKTDLIAARAELARICEVASVSVFGLTGAVGVMVVFACRRSLALNQFPPPGSWSWGRARAVVTGPRARTLAHFGLALGVTLVAASAAGGGLLWYMARVLRACRAGVTLT
jgi:hypothetical protein